jgi:hypothetical protein
MNRGDLEAQILATRNAKEYADFAMFTMHVHANRSAFQAYSQDHYPVDFLKDLTHTLVENGMDMYVGHGNHTMQGIEIYKGRPIFYNLGNFAVHRFGADDSGTGTMTSIERSEGGDEWLQQYINLVAYVATSKFQDGVLEEVRIYPVDLGVDRASRPWSKMSIPMTPSPQLANRILTEIQKYSEPFGTKITIENGVGVIKVPRDANCSGRWQSAFDVRPSGTARQGAGRLAQAGCSSVVARRRAHLVRQRQVTIISAPQRHGWSAVARSRSAHGQDQRLAAAGIELHGEVRRLNRCRRAAAPDALNLVLRIRPALHDDATRLRGIEIDQCDSRLLVG